MIILLCKEFVSTTLPDETTQTFHTGNEYEVSEENGAYLLAQYLYAFERVDEVEDSAPKKRKRKSKGEDSTAE